MGRLHSKGKGISSSALPYSRSAPAWLKTTPDQVVDQICKLAKKGATPSQIGVVLRDSHGVAQVKIVTGMLEIWMRNCIEDKLLTKFLQETRSSVFSSPTVRYYLRERKFGRQMTAGKSWNTTYMTYMSKLRLCLVSD